MPGGAPEEGVGCPQKPGKAIGGLGRVAEGMGRTWESHPSGPCPDWQAALQWPAGVCGTGAGAVVALPDEGRRNGSGARLIESGA